MGDKLNFKISRNTDVLQLVAKASDSHWLDSFPRIISHQYLGSVKKQMINVTCSWRSIGVWNTVLQKAETSLTFLQKNYSLASEISTHCFSSFEVNLGWLQCKFFHGYDKIPAIPCKHCFGVGLGIEPQYFLSTGPSLAPSVKYRKWALN